VQESGLGRQQRDPGARRRFRRAVLASIFSSYFGYGTGSTFVAGLTPAIWVGTAVVAVAAIAALSIPRRRGPAVEAELVPDLEAAA
jgi:hypothetical protein